METYNMLKKEIRRYIYDQKWQQFTKIQDHSIKLYSESEDNLILIAPTASGKTEAAFLPAINSIENWEEGIKIVYISPLIALINDQFNRISELCKYMEITVTRWHGEASQSKKRDILKNPKGILLITPESLEALFVTKSDRVRKLFYNVENIIVDEIHSFIGSNRGIQLKSLLERMNSYIENNNPRIIGMSATVSEENYSDLKEIFQNERTTKIIRDKGRNELKIDYNFYSDKTEALNKIYEYSKREIMLVFPNTRQNVEMIAANLKKKAQKEKINISYFSHHASVSKNIRTMVENFAKESNKNLFTICCTSTLELGIDIGAVDSIVQYNAPHSVSSLAQRLGRSGRRTGINNLHFISDEKWDLLQGLSAISIYKKGKVDKIDVVKKPYDVMAHQILSLIVEKSEINLSEFKKIIQKYQTWKNIEYEEFSNICNHLLKEKYIEILDNSIIAGVNLEKLLKKAEFYTQFKVEDTYSVYNNQIKIGELPLEIGVNVTDNIYLAAGIWKIKKVEEEARKIFVEKAKDGKPPIFFGEGVEITDELRKEMKAILFNSKTWEDYSEEIKKVLEIIFKNIILKSKIYFYLEKDKKEIKTFRSTKIDRTLRILLLIFLDLKDFGELNDVVLSSSQVIEENINKIIINGIEGAEIKKFLEKDMEEAKKNGKKSIVERNLTSNKYMFLIPDNLKIKYFIENKLDIEGIKDFLETTK
ncbi:DEAD/DEAH box helicase domain protein [Leptotrichia trevisanii]|uniref:DEAD/DEAH box helicase domain protein n=1 Tax=Leptotrichia trevisanii TaxID=109328 RepID=A0A510L701_9FUSO|nr:DEAD/DEAH box helicase [Leptotrichia trevisanii]BBM45872.1 DEAD/DEAH box helicase domain protein [Leptotrichia trevisanii]BBM53084.1 DEAD/DEAH box helicase domain protein [Leptotrichia trevisanii]BBM57875.1 DEAD/DEAH box helicase domain protein [Leptotrichia trevisanii]